MKGGRPKWHSDGIGGADVDVIDVDHFVSGADVSDADAGALGAGDGFGGLLVTGCNFC